MTPTDEELTSFVAELCRLPEYEGKWELNLLGRDFVLIDSQMMFTEKHEHRIISILIRHLIEEEIVAKGFMDIRCIFGLGSGWMYYLGKSSVKVAGPFNPNKTRAVALAAFRALEGKV